MSGQSSLILLVGVIVVVIILWVSNIFSQTSVRTRILVSTGFSKITKYLDIIKGISRSSLVLSTHRGTYDAAQMGRTYFCNGPASPTTEEMRYDLGNLTLKYLNSYLTNLESLDPLITINTTNSTCVDYPVIDTQLNAGLLDESFDVNSYGSSVKITLGKNEVFSENDISDNVVRDRFWLLYRGFRTWAQTTSFADKMCDNCMGSICGCPSGFDSCGQCPDLVNCLKYKVIRHSVEELEEIFLDPYIECSGDINCCYGEMELCAAKSDACGIWTTNRCMRCDRDRSSNLCSDQLVNGDLASLLGLATAQTLYQCDYWYETRISVTISLTCVDRKYELSIPSVGDRYLKFTILASLGLQKSPNCGGTSIGSTRGGCDCAEYYPPPTVPTTIPVATTSIYQEPQPPSTIPPP